ncbi:bacitracin ABC transporter ATP-binding protein [Niastella yeongjuensis]|uniref:Bacitracin ABC transporter ATP-binding protein n=1 Tax=Niastella yeongjuensis TaxID=354355 RepID=A0A1V9EXW3_9BACT|nr:ABC transporter ATP-binding protein [Niastella yeongjuensis]OQP50960.1 bacitracin ABC transporter ATP-binding protein [Niastella yeongjuensis]SEN09540.1 ABC-2 type transport system ATP-binding protein [Niastella yeongjuensis]
MSAIIKVDNLSKQYHEVNAVNDISFTVNTGDIYGFLGQNGAGKSTTIRMLLTLIAPTAGSIELFGRNLHTNRKEVLQQIGAVIEKPDLYKYLTAYENLSLFARMSGVKVTQNKLQAQLEQVGLSERAHSKVRTFSQGMKQRLGIAIALIHDPKLIILDEPTNGLDPQGIADIRNLILHLSRHQGKTILVSSHLLHEIELIANRMLIIDKGKKIMEGTVAELVDPARTMVHLEVTNPQQVVAWLQSSRWSTCLQEQHNNVILLQMNKQQVPELTADLVQAGANIMALQPQNSLESYFLSLTTENRHVDTFTN